MLCQSLYYSPFSRRSSLLRTALDGTRCASHRWRILSTVTFRLPEKRKTDNLPFRVIWAMPSGTLRYGLKICYRNEVCSEECYSEVCDRSVSQRRIQQCVRGYVAVRLRSVPEVDATTINVCVMNSTQNTLRFSTTTTCSILGYHRREISDSVTPSSPGRTPHAHFGITKITDKHQK